VCALFPVNLLLSQNNNISLRGLRKSARRCACALGRAWSCFRYKYIDHRLKCEQECALLILPRAMAPMDIFPYRACKSKFNCSPTVCPSSRELRIWNHLKNCYVVPPLNIG
jgi:hypothetical protein